LFLRAPGGALAALTLLVACFLMAGGLFKIVAAASYRFAAWGWTLGGGIIDMILAQMIWQEWPAPALWVIGLFVGINLLLRGFNWIALAVALRRLPRLMSFDSQNRQLFGGQLPNLKVKTHQTA
jgi:uncharacterized membrane protein HdeD (DUF308 family)